MANPGKTSVAKIPPITEGIPTRNKVMILNGDSSVKVGPPPWYRLENLTAADWENVAASFSIADGLSPS